MRHRLIAACTVLVGAGCTSTAGTASEPDPSRVEVASPITSAPPDDPAPASATTSRRSPPPETVSSPSDAVTSPTPAPQTPRTATRADLDPPSHRAPLPELPEDLPTDPATPREHDHPHDGEPIQPSAADVAVEWVLVRHASRYDDEPGVRRERLAKLTSSRRLARTTDRTAPAARAQQAMWAVVHTVVRSPGGWWEVSYSLKRSGAGDVGVTSTPAELQVQVRDGQVVGERP